MCSKFPNTPRTTRARDSFCLLGLSRWSLLYTIFKFKAGYSQVEENIITLANDLLAFLHTFGVPYTIEEQSANSITFALNLGDGVTLQHIYSLADSYSEQEPYNIQHKPLTPPQPLRSTQSYSNGNKAKFTTIDKLVIVGDFLSSLE